MPEEDKYYKDYNITERGHTPSDIGKLETVFLLTILEYYDLGRLTKIRAILKEI